MLFTKRQTLQKYSCDVNITISVSVACSPQVCYLFTLFVKAGGVKKLLDTLWRSSNSSLNRLRCQCNIFVRRSLATVHLFEFEFQFKQIYCPTKYRIEHHGCDYMAQITTGMISMNIHTYTYLYIVTNMLNRHPTLNQMLGGLHFRPRDWKW